MIRRRGPGQLQAVKDDLASLTAAVTRLCTARRRRPARLDGDGAAASAAAAAAAGEGAGRVLVSAGGRAGRAGYDGRAAASAAMRSLVT